MHIAFALGSVQINGKGKLGNRLARLANVQRPRDNFKMCCVTSISEMWHGRQWLTDPMYQAPSVETSVGQVFVSDFVQVTDQHLGVFHGKVQHFYMKV